jgi:tryptophan-rich sensory protein
MPGQLALSNIRTRDALDFSRAAAGVMLSAAQPLAAYMSQLTGRGVPEVERARRSDGPVTPTDGTFAIWGPLFLGSVAWAGWSARAEQRGDPSLRRIGWLACGVYASNIAWSLQAQLWGLCWPSLALIGTSAANANAALIEAVRAPRARLATWTLGPLAGWLTLATFANLEATLNDAFGRPSKQVEERRAIALLGTATAAASAVAVASRGSLPFAAAVAWGLGGTAVRNVRERRPALALAACAGLAALAGITLLAQRRQ